MLRNILQKQTQSLIMRKASIAMLKDMLGAKRESTVQHKPMEKTMKLLRKNRSLRREGFPGVEYWTETEPQNERNGKYLVEGQELILSIGLLKVLVRYKGKLRSKIEAWQYGFEVLSSFEEDGIVEAKTELL